MAESYKPTTEIKQELAELIHPITADLEHYKAQLGDGTKEFRGLSTGYDYIDKPPEDIRTELSSLVGRIRIK